MTELTRTQARRAQRKAAADQRAREAYYDRLPQALASLQRMLPKARTPWHAEVIQHKIDTKIARTAARAASPVVAERRAQWAAEAEQDRRVQRA